jgi:histidinol-phosphatase (PHP family)
VFAQYVDSVIDLACSGTVDVLAHVDVVKVAGHRAGQLNEHERRLVEGVAASNVIVELSSAGLRKPVDDTYPSGTLLDRFLEAGVKLTTASDAHTADQVGWAFDHLMSVLESRSVDTLTTFSRRRPITYQR